MIPIIHTEDGQEYRKRLRLVDSREPWEIQQALIETGWERVTLHCGDFLFQNHNFQRVVVTRKTVDDLLNSIGERFAKQLEEILDYAQVCVLLVEGNWTRLNPRESIISSRGVAYHTWDMVWNYIHRWQTKGFVLELTTGKDHTVRRLNALYALHQKPNSMSARSKQFSDDRVLALPSGVRGTTGLKLLKHFGSLRQLANAGIEDMLSVDGIGNKKANLVVNHFNRNGAE